MPRTATALLRLAVACFSVALLAGCATAGRSPLPNGAPSSAGSAARPHAHQSEAQRGLWPRNGPAVPLCGPVPRGFSRCFAWVRTDIHGVGPDGTPQGYEPSDLQTAYNLSAYSAANGKGQTVALVDAYDDPNAEADLGVYRKEWGLSACTTANGCFRKVAFTSTTSAKWAGEESLDVDMVSAICPNCHIVLVEAATNGDGDFTTAEEYAFKHATYISNSWGGDEGNTSYDGNWNEPAGTAVTASTGDNGFAQKDGSSTAQWPAILPTVIAVGGTDLLSISPRQEKAWNNAGSGCSTVYPKPPFQAGIATGCSKRAQADVSASAGTCCGVAVYDSFGASGWRIFGGTSEASPIIASVYAIAGCASNCAIFTNNTQFLYEHASSLNDITSGSNGSCGAPLCTAGHGWDGPTGLGTPNGIGAFTPPDVTISPSSVSFTFPYAIGAKTVDIAQSDYTGKFTESDDCSKIARVKQNSNGSGKAHYSVEPIDEGNCNAKFEGGDGKSTKLSISVAPGPVQITPASLNFTASGNAYTHGVKASQGGYTGTFTFSGTCSPETTIKIVANTGGAADFNVTPEQAGSCEEKVAGGHGQSSKLPITVTLPGPIVLSPTSMTLTGMGTGTSANVDLTQTDFTGNFTESNVCTNLAAVSTVSNAYGKATYKVTATDVDSGSCYVTFGGGFGQTAKLNVTVTLPALSILLTPKSLTFTGPGAAVQTVAVSEAYFKGGYTESNTCTNIATVALLNSSPGSATYKVTPTGSGSCSAKFSGESPATATLPIAVATATPPPGPVKLTPSTLTFYNLTPLTVDVSESNYTGTFTESGSSCSGIVTFSATSNADGSASYSVTPVATGYCTATITGGNGQYATLFITVDD